MACAVVLTILQVVRAILQVVLAILQVVITILQVINELGSWSLTPFSSNANDKLPAWDFITALITYHKMGQSPLFLFSITVDDKNNSRYMIQVIKNSCCILKRQPLEMMFTFTKLIF